MFWISLILVSLFFVFYWLWPKKGYFPSKQVPIAYNLFNSSIKETQTIKIERVVYFEAGSFLLANKEIQNLKEWMAPILSQSLDSVHLVGSADHTGNLANNRKLVKERTKSIRKILISLGVPSEKIHSKTLEPLFGKTSLERERYRSVEIKLTVIG
ncbi:OmpA family protein [Leptospira sp. WS39.C2]